MSDRLVRVHSEAEAAFWQKLTLPQEAKDYDAKWDGVGYRWFRSANVVCFEHYRRLRVQAGDALSGKSCA
jgi:hypothetical protein